MKSFPGTTSKELAHYVAPHLSKRCWNQSELQQQSVLQNIMKILHQCKEHGVKEIVFSSVVVAGNINAEVLNHFNFLMTNVPII